jgi:hypothetical protein
MMVHIQVTEASSAILENAMTAVLGVTPGYVLIATVSQPAAATPKIVTANIANADAEAAGRIAQRIVPDNIVSGLALYGFKNSSFISIGVTACVPGFALVSTDCRPCAVGYYCEGGTEPSKGCDVGTFSLSRATSFSSCWEAEFVILSARFLTQDLDRSVVNETEKRFRSALINLLSVTGVPADAIVVGAKKQYTQRRAFAELILYTSRRSGITQVDAGIAVVPGSSPTVADRIKSYLNQQLKLEGLPPAMTLSLTITGEGAVARGSSSVWLIAGLVIGCCVTAFLVSSYLLSRVKTEAEEERQLRIKMEELRERFGITLQEGFVLNTEAGKVLMRSCVPRGRNLAEMTVVRRSYLESAAHLALLEVCHTKTRKDSF